MTKAQRQLLRSACDHGRVIVDARRRKTVLQLERLGFVRFSDAVAIRRGKTLRSVISVRPTTRGRDKEIALTWSPRA
jgi:hypothetical protein